MYAEFYKLSGRPFQLTPDPRFYFDSSTHRKAMAYLSYGLNQGEGFIIVTGEIGAGKTTLVGHLFDGLDRERFVAAKVVTTQLNADDTLRMVASAFGIKTEAADKATLLQRIEHFLRSQHRSGKRALLIIDEAQNLPKSALEELRMLSNFQDGGRALLQSFLLGQPEFRDKWALDPDLEQLRQRVIATHHLSTMTAEETEHYIRHRMELVGWKDDPHFTADAYQAIYEFTGGLPRKLNTLCSRILLFGAIEELHTINGDVVNDVIEDLERDNRAAAKARDEAEKAEAAVNELKYQLVEKPLPPTSSQQDLPAATNNHDSFTATLADMERRMAVMEEYIRVHDDTIKQALDIAARWLAAEKENDTRET